MAMAMAMAMAAAQRWRWRGREESISKRGRLRFREGLASDGIRIERRSESAFDGRHFVVVAERGRRRRMGAHNH